MTAAVVVRAWLATPAILAALAMLATDARADDTERQACIDAAERGQAEMKAARLIEARRDLAVCGRDVCPGLIRRDCTQWREEIEAAMPTIVFGAHDGKGRDVVDANVFVDGKAIEHALDGKPREIDPGTHVVRVEGKDGKHVEQSILVRQGEKARVLVVQLEPLEVTPLVSGEKTVTHRAPIPIATWILGGLGVASSGVFVYFGLKGVSDRKTLHCDSGCPSVDHDHVARELTAADIALGVAIVSFGAALTVYLTRGETTEPESMALTVQPRSGGGVATWQIAF